MIPAETEAYIERIRSSQPVRKVRSRASNVSGRYPSVKMGRSIQFESHHVELWGIYEMERDDDVLELSLDLVRRARGAAGGELRDRAFDPQARSVDRVDVLGFAVHEGDVVPSACEMRAKRPADRAGAPHEELHGVSLRDFRRVRRRSD